MVVFLARREMMDKATYNIDVLERQLAAIDSMAAVKGRRSKTSNIWIYHSPKNRKRFAVEGDAVFFASMLYEGDPAVSWYLPEKTRLLVSRSGEVSEIEYNIEVQYVDGRTEWVRVVNEKSSTRKRRLPIEVKTAFTSVSQQRQGDYLTVTRDSLQRKANQMDNWLLLSAASTRAASLPRHTEATLIDQILPTSHGVPIKRILQAKGGDPAILLAAIADGLRLGTLQCSSQSELITYSSVIYRATSSSIKPEATALRSESEQTESGSASGLNPESWPVPDVSMLDPSIREQFYTRRNAILMRLAGCDALAVFRSLGISGREQRRLLSRCKTATVTGGVVGFYACIPGKRIKEYERTEPITHVEGEKGGCAGALDYLFRKHPMLQKYVDDLYLKRPIKGYVHEPKITVQRIKELFIKELRTLGYTDTHWPLNTSSRGYVSLCHYVKSLHTDHYIRAAQARYGSDSARRAKIGTEETVLIQARRPYSIMQLDYQLIDAASVIVIVNRFGVEIDVRVPRWYYGLMGDEQNGLITGVFIGFETSPTSDCALKVIDSALRPQIYSEDDPRIAYIVDGKILPNEIIPSLEHQCFSALRVDNGWANAARATVNTIIDVVGCAVNFGPPRAWWSRNVIERVFGDLTRRGLQRLPSSYGSGPKDPLKDEPARKASEFRILASELVGIISGAVKHHNIDKSSGREYSSPLQAISAAIKHERSGFISQPIPLSVQQDRRLLTYVVECTVAGNPKAGIRPHVKWDECIYRNERLAQRDDLIGSKIIFYCDLDDIRNVVATLKETGEDFGAMIPERRWAIQAVSVRFRKLINRHGKAAKNAQEIVSPVELWAQEKAAGLHARKQSKRRKTRANGATPQEIAALAAMPQEKKPSASSLPAITDKVHRRRFGAVTELDLSVVSRKR
jgi:putative transposase